MVGIIQSFLKIKYAVKKALIDLDLSSLFVEDNVPHFETSVNVLNTIKDAVEALGRRGTNLIIGDAIMNTLYEQLLSGDSLLSEKMVHTIKSKVNERYNDKLMSVVNYLNTSQYNNINITKKMLQSYAEQMYKRLFQGTEITSAESDEVISIAQVYQCFKEKLENAVNGDKEKSRNLKLKIDNLFRRELALFEASTNRTEFRRTF